MTFSVCSLGVLMELLFCLVQRIQNSFRCQRQSRNPDPQRIFKGIGHRRCDWQDAAFTHAFGSERTGTQPLLLGN